MRALVPLALAALLSSCAALPAPPADGFDPAQYEGAPLRARIVSANGRLLVNTSRPAHVAIFEIIPGRGVGLLYPAYRGENNYFSGGLNTVHLTQSRLYYTYFQPAPFSRVGGPRYLYMIASDSPLRLSGLVSSPGALRRNLGLARFAGTQPYGLMEELADLVLSYGAPGDWAEDVYTIWDDRGYDTGGYVARDWIRIQCADGRILEGPAYYIYGACDQGRGYAPPLRNPEQPSDSGAVKPPTRRRPEPRDPSAEEGQGTKPPVVVPIPEPEPVKGFSNPAQAAGGPPVLPGEAPAGRPSSRCRCTAAVS
ncbi:MAG TPA: hypothetical protein VHG51_00720, partial [Longimicrobiaceae bacterium]|nr:hypothetical protein [Longimicrobiaceae bacterium]